MAEKPQSKGEVEEGKSGAGAQGDGLEYCRVLSEEQLTGFYEKAAIDNAAAVKFMALEILKLPNFMYEGKTACVLDYFVGVLMFAQEEHIPPAQTMLVYQLAMEILEKIKKGASMKKIEKTFKRMIFSWSVKVKNTAHVASLTTIELQKIVPFFMETVFQHYRLYKNLFNRESLHWRYCEEVYINTPPDGKFLKPLKEFYTSEEIDLDRASKELHRKKMIQEQTERQVPEAEAQSWRDKTSEPRRPPDNLDEYIDFTIRDKVDEVTVVMQDQYEACKQILINRIESVRSVSK